ncbi:CoA transferase [Pseudenhygromyxa sp. WMMC2535]|uniref:CaiB/BaiF CoA transferase family protein n=1 Tax=Pseudenhygromyxa sp. WMMC2535 TaxID=2712867 RepID=UPI001552E9C4|nr:CoA transferase [Pseudenhygromyxa sp. WMMC2535]NVB42100.1 CoA transferase [Pseudenhygromyxa sp. WMMC2535]
MSAAPPPLEGVLVIDCSRMVPGAVLARGLIDLGARLIKVEAPRGGDPLRAAPPLMGGTGAGFCAHYRGAQSLRLDLREAADMAKLRTLLRRADVFIESFRSGTLARWGLDLDAVEDENPRLITCSLPGIAEGDDRVAHDLNLTGLTGLLDLLPGQRLHLGDGHEIPRVLVADVTTGLLACTSVLAAILGRANTGGRGRRVSQSLASGPLPLLTWPWADAAAGGGGLLRETALSGRAPCYRCYRCGDGKLLSVGCLEPKFWIGFCQAIELPELAVSGLDLDARGQATAAAVSERLASRPRDEWLTHFAAANLPVAPVHELDEARADPLLATAGLLEHTPMPDGGSLQLPGPATQGIGRTPDRPAPALGEHDVLIACEFGLG